MTDSRKEFEKAFPSSKAYRGGTQTGYFEPWSLAFTAWQAARRAALEEAAKVCDAILESCGNEDQSGCVVCANAIRALAAQTGQEGNK